MSPRIDPARPSWVPFASADDLQALNLGRFFDTDPAPLVLYSTTPANVALVMVDGRLQKRDGRLLEVSVEKVLGEAEASLESIRSRVGSE